MSLPSLVELPDTLKHLTSSNEQSLRSAVAAVDGLSLDSWTAERWAGFARVSAASEFVLEQSVRDPAMLLGLVDSGELDRRFAPGELCTQLATAAQAATTEEELARNLRRQRTRQQVRIIWRDLTRQADLVETCRDLSDMADAAIDQAYQWLYPRHCQQFGTPIGNRSGLPQQMVVLGMGKLGAVELNLSSDIDLIFAFPEGGETEGVKRSLDNQEFFTRLGQRLIKALDPITVDGFVFRVDMRLRPYGSSGALTLSFNALEQYYQDQGRDWERYAMIKARVVAGDQVAGAQLQEMLRPFVYRRYLDFSAIEALRTMKQLIQQEVRRKGMSENIKLGAGGIREVEFIAQAFQLIHGGRDLSLQQRPLLKVLATLEGQGYLPAAVVDELREGYLFLRYTEHAIQAIADRQTQMLPDGDLDRARIAFMLGFPDWAAFHAQLMHWRGRIDWHFRQVISDPDDEEGEGEVVVGGEWLPLWEEAQDEEAACRQLEDAGFRDAPRALKLLAGLRSSPNLRSMQRLSRERLDSFIPRLLAQAVEHKDPDLVLERVLPLVEAVARRSAYLVLLTENPGALRRLLTLCAASPWIAEQIARFPLLLQVVLGDAGQAFAQFGGQFRRLGRARSFDHLRYEEQAAFDRGGALLVGFALVGLAGHVVAQAQLHVLDGGHGVGHRCEARGIHSPHLLHDVEEAVQLGQHALTFGRCQFEPRQIGDAADVLGGQCHRGMNLKKPDVNLSSRPRRRELFTGDAVLSRLCRNTSLPAGHCAKKAIFDPVNPAMAGRRACRA